MGWLGARPAPGSLSGFFFRPPGGASRAAACPQERPCPQPDLPFPVAHARCRMAVRKSRKPINIPWLAVLRSAANASAPNTPPWMLLVKHIVLNSSENALDASPNSRFAYPTTQDVTNDATNAPDTKAILIKLILILPN
jgi:hypothetical protein